MAINMLVKVKIKDVIASTEKAVLFLFKYEREEWLPRSWFKKGRGNYIIMSESHAREKGLQFTNLMHFPEKIEPKHNQEAIDELRYEAKSCN